LSELVKKMSQITALQLVNKNENCVEAIIPATSIMAIATNGKYDENKIFIHVCLSCLKETFIVTVDDYTKIKEWFLSIEKDVLVIDDYSNFISSEESEEKEEEGEIIYDIETEEEYSVKEEG
jgi:hypothetical protein